MPTDELTAAVRGALAAHFTRGRLAVVPEHDEFDVRVEMLLDDIQERIKEEAQDIKEEIQEDADSWDL